MTITINTLAYEEDTVINPNVVRYVGPSNTFSEKDYLDLRRTAPKATATSRGKAKSKVTRVRTVTLDDGSTDEAYVTTEWSLPVGMAKADADALRDDVGDFTISSNGDDLSWKHDIRQ